MDIVEAIRQRKAIRAYKGDPVPRQLLEAILSQALRAPSWSNTQPWEFIIASGAKLEEIRQAISAGGDGLSTLEIAGPQSYPEPFDSRRRSLSASLLGTLGISREDKVGRRQWSIQGSLFFGAPAVIFILIDKSFYFHEKGLNAWPLFDCGSVAENIMLLAAANGLGTIAEIQAVARPEILRNALDIPPSKLLVLGIAIGYPDETDPVNQFTSEREPLDKVARWYGFS